MRFFSALTLYVSLAAALPAADWLTLHREGLEAIQRGDYPAAANFFRQSAPLAQNPVQRGLSANDLGVTLYQLKQECDARRLLEDSIAIWKTIPGQEVRLAQSTEALTTVYRTLGEYPAAESALRDALKTPPPDTDTHALLRNELGDILRETGHAVESRRLYESTLNLPDITVRRRLDATLGLADLDREAHLWPASFARWNSAAEESRAQHWPKLEAASLRGLGITFLEHGETARAEPLLRRSLALFESSGAPPHQVASTLSCLSQLYLSERKLGLAEETLRRALALSEKTLGPQHPQVAVLFEMLGDTISYRNQLAQAGDYYRRARLIMAARFGERSAIAAAVDASWALVEQRAKHNQEAAADYEKALAVLDAAGPDADPIRATVHQRYAELCKTLHRKNSPAVQSFRAPSAKGQVAQSQ